MRPSPLLAFSLALTAALPACDAAPDPTPGPAIRDSAGITIVENLAPAWSEAERWFVPPEPALEIGVQDGAPEYQLFRVGDAARLPDGRIAIANTGGAEIRVYGADGSYDATIGRRGQGPGELHFPQELYVAGDTLIVVDGLELELFRLDGRHLTRRTLDPTLFINTLGSGHFSEGAFALPGGEWLLHVYERGVLQAPLGALYRGDLLYMRWEPVEGSVDTLALHGGIEQARFDHGGRPSHAVALFARRSDWHIDWSGDRVLLGNGERPEVEVHGPGGTLRLVRWPDERPEVTPEDIAAERQARLDWIRTLPPDQAAERRRTLEALPDPDRFPAHGSLRTDAHGSLWVQEYPVPTGGADRWRVFDPSGILLGTVALPKDLRVLEIGDDDLLALHRDDLGVERLRVYRLQKPPR